ncbi:MAG TPA: GLUG motif-containing protein [Spirochaetota bacterium]|nr:GLUG motif-containing protein [Spirochaetota bacterium]
MKHSVKLTCMILAVSAALHLSACDDSGGQGDSTPWDSISVTGITARNDSIDIFWKNSSDHVEITWSLDGETVDSGNGITQYGITGLSPGTEYDITLAAVDSSGNRSANQIMLDVYTTGGAEKNYSLIYTLSQLDAVRENPGGDYLLMADIDLNVRPHNSGDGWSPIGNGSDPFTGSFNGNNHVVKNMYINTPGVSHRGFFGYTAGAFICNLGLETVNVTGGDDTGSLAGWSDSSSIIDCFAAGSVSGDYSTGGLVGFSIDSDVRRCYASAVVAGGANCTGGLIGGNYSSDLTDCYAIGPVGGRAYTGGLVGWNGYASVFTSCYAAGTVTASIATAYKGGLVGYDYDGSTTYGSCFYDTMATGMNSANQDYGAPRTTSEMKSPATFTGIEPAWDFDSVWGMDGSINAGYPYLRDNH